MYENENEPEKSWLIFGNKHESLIGIISYLSFSILFMVCRF